MLAELHKLSALEKQMEKWEKELDSDLAVSQRISEKTQADKIRLIEEKRKMVRTFLDNYFSLEIFIKHMVIF